MTDYNMTFINTAARDIIASHCLPFDCPLPDIDAAVNDYCDDPSMPDMIRRRIAVRIDLTLN